MAKIMLRECLKKYVLDTHRSKNPESTRHHIDTLQDRLGIRVLGDVSSLDRVDIPVYTCQRFRSDKSTTDHTGKGISQTQAQVSLIMEAAERYAAELQDADSKRLIRGSYSNFRFQCNTINPEELILPRPGSYRPHQDYLWAWGYDLISDSEILVPACSVFHPFNHDDPAMIPSHTNGLASGNTMEEAVFHALTEVIERDSLSINQFTGKPSDSLYIEDTAEYSFISDIADKFSRAQIEIVSKDITSDIGIPVVAAYSNDTVQQAMTGISGFGAHLDPRVAMARALLELAATRAFVIQKQGNGNLMPLFSAFYAGLCETHDYRFFSCHHKGLGELSAEFSDDILMDIKILTNKLISKGFEKIIAVDLTRPEIGIPTVRVIVPGMEVYCFDRTRRGSRLYAAL